LLNEKEEEEVPAATVVAAAGSTLPLKELAPVVPPALV
jgi:hypothetical protein